MFQALACLEPPETREAPELVEQDGRHHAEPGENEGREAVMPAQ